MAAKDELGRDGEQRAADYLSAQGYVVLERNWRCASGEIDIVARSGDEIVVVEVKARTSEAFGHPLEAVDERKRRRLWRLAALWCLAHPDAARGRSIRLDAVAVLGGVDAPRRIEHLRDLR